MFFKVHQAAPSGGINNSALNGVQPSPGFFDRTMIKVADFGGSEGFAEYTHSMLPLRFPHHGNSLYVAQMLSIELDILPKRACRPAMEIVHFDQQSDFAVLLDRLLHSWDEMFVILLGKFAGQMNFKHLAIVRFLER
jgi:hypothetical protein